MNESVKDMTCYECGEDYDAPSSNGMIDSDECPNCGSDATYQKGKKNTFAEDTREDRMAQDPR
jgi:predicted  nucleic acid-binding Zn-ribbon protein